MPCHDPRDDPRYFERVADETQLRLDRLTRVSCDMRTILRREGLEQELTVETRTWVEEHDEWDERRIAQEEERGEREKVRLAALDKLSLEERRVLGL